MKNLTPYLPFALISAVVLAGVYFLYYKPLQDKRKAEQVAANAEYQKQLLADDPNYVKLLEAASSATSQSATGSQQQIGNFL